MWRPKQARTGPTGQRTQTTAPPPSPAIARDRRHADLRTDDAYLLSSRTTPAAGGLAYLVVPHMDPTHKLLLAELLQRATSMPLPVAVDAQRIEPKAVYVMTPDTELTVSGGTLHLAKPAEPRGQRLPIEVLFGSLARELGERALRTSARKRCFRAVRARFWSLGFEDCGDIPAWPPESSQAGAQVQSR